MVVRPRMSEWFVKCVCRGTLGARLNLLVATCLLPLLAVTLLADYVEYQVARQAIGAQALGDARGFADDIAHALAAHVAALQTLALSSELAAPDPAAFRPKLDAFLNLQPPGSALALIAADGQRVLATAHTPPAAPAAEAPLRAAVFGAGRAALAVGTAAAGERPPVFLGVPVSVGGAVRYALLLAIPPAVLDGIAAAQHPPPGLVMIVADGTGRVLGLWPPGDDTAVGEQLAPALLGAMRMRDSGVTETAAGLIAPPAPPTASSRGLSGRLLVAFAAVPGDLWVAKAWYAAVAVPRRILDVSLWWATGLILAAGLVLLAAGLALAQRVARSIRAPIARLVALAADPEGSGPAPSTGLPEADEVATALRAEASACRAALAEAKALTTTLETRIATEVAAREAAQSRAAQAERMQALGWLAGGIAHDFNNVLQTVENAATHLALRGGETPEVQRVVRLLRDAVRHGVAVTGRLLAFARREDLSPAPLALGPLLADLAEMLSVVLKETIRLEVDVPEGVPPVLADRGQLETVLINLAANARDAMPHGGTVRLAAREAAPPPGAPAGRRYVELSVADTGAGMAPEVLARVTEPFFTTKPPGKGTGLGLSLARNFAERSGGALRIDSTVGAGTTVRLWLPAAEQAGT